MTDYPAASYTTLAATLIALTYYIFSMSSYGRSNGIWGRQSPYPAHPEDRPVHDYVQYIGGSDYLDRPEYVPYDHRPSIARQHEYDDGEGPDVIHLRHMNHQHQIKFEAFAISDGVLSIRDIRDRAARKIGVRDPAQIRLLYKGSQLKDDKRSAKSYGLKQNSEIMVVVSEAPPSRPNSDSETEGSGSIVSHGSKKGRDKNRRGEARYHSDHLSPASPDQDSFMSRRNSMRRDRRNERQPSPHPHPQPQPEPRSPPIIHSHSPPASPLPSPRNDAARAKLDSLTSIFHTQWVPKCVQFLMNPPSDPKTRDLEHKRLSESIMTQILLSVDDIQTGEDLEARGMRKKLVSEINEMFRNLDKAKEEAS